MTVDRLENQNLIHTSLIVASKSLRITLKQYCMFNSVGRLIRISIRIFNSACTISTYQETSQPERDHQNPPASSHWRWSSPPPTPHHHSCTDKYSPTVFITASSSTICRVKTCTSPPCETVKKLKNGLRCRLFCWQCGRGCAKNVIHDVGEWG